VELVAGPVMSPQAVAMLKSWARVFLAAVVAAVMTAMTTNVWDWRAIGFAGLAAVLPVILRWLDAGDPAYGRGSDGA